MEEYRVVVLEFSLIVVVSLEAPPLDACIEQSLYPLFTCLVSDAKLGKRWLPCGATLEVPLDRIEHVEEERVRSFGSKTHYCSFG